MIRVELTTDQRAALKTVFGHVADGQQLILTADGVELAALIPMSDFDLLQEIEDTLDSELIEEVRAERVASAIIATIMPPDPLGKGSKQSSLYPAPSLLSVFQPTQQSSLNRIQQASIFEPAHKRP